MQNWLLKWYWWSDTYFKKHFSCSMTDYILNISLPLVERHLSGRKKLLDAACGSGNMYLQKIDISKAETTGLDIDASVRKTNKLHKNIVIQDMHEFKTEPQFDAIFSLFTWEHLHSPEKVLKNFYSSLLDEGVLIIVASNKWYYLSAIDRLLSKHLRNLVWKTLKGRKEMPYPTYYQQCTEKDLRCEAENTGFRCLSYNTFDMPPMWFMGIPPLFVIFTAQMKLFNRYSIFKPLRSTFIAVLEKKS